MQTTKQRLKDYIKKITQDIVNITDDQIDEILLISAEQDFGRATFFFYSLNTNTGKGEWIPNKWIEVEDILLKKIIADNINLCKEPEEQRRWYKYECKDSNKKYLGTIYTSDNNLF